MHPQTAIVDRFAELAHRGQVDKSGNPYIEHPRAVARYVSQVPAFADLDHHERTVAVQAALLHDVIEDTPVGPANLAALGIHPDTITVVELLTHKANQARTDYYTQILTHPIARIVKVADLAHNLSPSRMAALPDATQARLLAKYRPAVDRMTAGHPADRDWLDHPERHA